jgi:transposase
MRKPLSIDLRQRIVAAYDAGEGTRADVAQRFRVSEGMVKKLLQQRRATGDLAPCYHRCKGRKPVLLASHRQQLRLLLAKEPDLTLQELHAALGVACTIQAIHYVLADLGLTYKKRHSAPASRTDPTSRRRGGAGGANSRGSTRRG